MYIFETTVGLHHKQVQSLQYK